MRKDEVERMILDVDRRGRLLRLWDWWWDEGVIVRFGFVGAAAILVYALVVRR